MTETQQQSKRAQETQRTRRRRSDSGPLAGLKLAVPEDLKEPGFEYRWVNDDEVRIHAKTVEDDWDVVKSKAIDGTGEGTPVSRNVGRTESGAPLRAVLCRKPLDWYRVDKAKEQERLKTQETHIKQGGAPAAGGLQGPTTYIPDRADGFSSDKQGRNSLGG